MNITTETKSIIQEIKDKNPRIIGIDGIDGIGKTTLAKDIEKLGYYIVSLDDFLAKNSREYFNFIDFAKLCKKIKQLSNKQMVIEGVLLQKVLKK